MWSWIKGVADRRVLHLFRSSASPEHELALATSVGLFWALTPLVGIQMTLVFINWLLFRLVRLPFHLPIALAWVWISNPFTLLPLYYSFYISGYWFLALVGDPLQLPSFDQFISIYQEAQLLPLGEKISYWLDFMLHSLGWPSLVGGFIIGTITALPSYQVTIWLVRNWRKRRTEERRTEERRTEERRIEEREPAPEDRAKASHPHPYARGLSQGDRSKEQIGAQKA